MRKKADIGFFQEQQPNGLIANSEMRGLVAIPMVMAFLYLMGSLYFYNLEVNKLIVFLHDGVIKSSEYIAMRGTLVPVNWMVLGSLITLALGGKLYQKGQEETALNNEQKINGGPVTQNTESPESLASLQKARADYFNKFGKIVPDNKTLEEIQNAINSNAAFV